ncbi:MAG TPA: hypothetical protein VLT45_03990 [Kofleriaceae bacterium]|nr:hypothetical protein [Kofleriaceae bacterium]
MPSRPDLREIASNVKEAFADLDRETLLDILTFVLKEYVVEGPPPMLIHQAETLADLRNASFAQIIAALQTRFDHPELQQFAVDGDQVSVRVGGVMQPLLAPRGGAAASPAAADLPRPAAGVRVVETTLQNRPPQPASAPPQGAAPRAASPAPQPGQAPPPSRGLSVRGRPAGEGSEAAPAQPPAASAQQPPAAAQPPASGAAPAAPKDDKPEGGDDASARFSLLELD